MDNIGNFGCHKVRYIIRVLLALLAILALSACGEDSDLTEDTPAPEAKVAEEKTAGGENDVGQGGEARLKGELLVPEEDVVFWVEGNPVSKQELFLYLQPKKEEAEAIYGDKVRSLALGNDGTTFAEALKEDIMNQILYTQTVCAQAEGMGISLSEDDMIDVNLYTEDYIHELSEEEITKYGITEDIVRKVYQDNQLATKVYESLVLNVDMDVPEEEIRHMVLQYITIMKFAKDANGKQIAYTEEEIEQVREQAEAFLEEAKKRQSLKPEVIGESESGVDLAGGADAAGTSEGEEAEGDDEYDVLELIADREEMTEKLSEEIMEKAFALKKGEYSGVLEDDYAFYILFCEEEVDAETTSEEKIRIIEERQEQLFASLYDEWEKNVDVKINWELWESIGW